MNTLLSLAEHYMNSLFQFICTTISLLSTTKICCSLASKWHISFGILNLSTSSDLLRWDSQYLFICPKFLYLIFYLCSWQQLAFFALPCAVHDTISKDFGPVQLLFWILMCFPSILPSVSYLNFKISWGIFPLVFHQSFVIFQICLFMFCGNRLAVILYAVSFLSSFLVRGVQLFK